VPFPVHLQRAIVAAITFCTDCDKFVESLSLKQSVQKLIWLIEETHSRRD
jgi:hypothetical protein